MGLEPPSSGCRAWSWAATGPAGRSISRMSAGVAHVFVSSLTGARFRLHARSMPGSAGVLTAGDHRQQRRRALVAFINGGELYAALEPNGLAAWQSPQATGRGRRSPALSMSTFNKAYLAFTATGAGGKRRPCAYFNSGQWSPVPRAAQWQPGRRRRAPGPAGRGSCPPATAPASSSGARAGHIYLRRVVGSSPSTATYQADPGSVLGSAEVSADEPLDRLGRRFLIRVGGFPGEGSERRDPARRGCCSTAWSAGALPAPSRSTASAGRVRRAPISPPPRRLSSAPASSPASRPSPIICMRCD